MMQQEFKQYLRSFSVTSDMSLAKGRINHEGNSQKVILNFTLSIPPISRCVNDSENEDSPLK